MIPDNCICPGCEANTAEASEMCDNCAVYGCTDEVPRHYE